MNNLQLMSPRDLAVFQANEVYWRSQFEGTLTRVDLERRYVPEAVPQSCWRLRGEKVRLNAKIVSFNPEGMIDQIIETTTEEVNKARVAIRPPRKQKAAKMYRPIETITVKPVLSPKPLVEVIAQNEGKTVQEAEIVALEMRIKKLMDLVEERKRQDEKKRQSIEELVRLFGRR